MFSLPPGGEEMNIRTGGLGHTWVAAFGHGGLPGSPSICGMQRLSGLDASFLYLETPTQPMHVCGVLELDTTTIPGGYSFEKLRTKLVERVEGISSFTEKLADSRLNLDHPDRKSVV